MPLVSSKELLLNAQKGKYAIAAFNIENMEMAQAVVRAAEDLRAPVLIAVTSGTLKYASPETYFALVESLVRNSPVPMAIHLDHGIEEDAVRCARAGFTSLMIDGSTLAYEDNVSLSRRVVEFARGIPVEAELGMVGGKEDDHVAKGDVYTNPAQAADFVNRTGISSLAVAIGTAHGVYKGEPKLDIDRLVEIRALVDVPLVLHGASGVPDEAVMRCVAEGICKVNYATELRIAYTRGVKAALQDKPDAFDPKFYGKAARESVYEAACGRINILGSKDRA